MQCKYCHKNFQSRTLSDKFAHLIGCTVFEQQHPALYAEVEEQQQERAVPAPPAPAVAGGLAAASSGSTAAAPAGLSGSKRSRTLHGWVAKGNASSAAGQDQQIHAALVDGELPLAALEVLQDYDLSSDSSKAVFGSGAAQPTQQPVATDIAPAAPGGCVDPDAFLNSILACFSFSGGQEGINNMISNIVLIIF